MFKSKFSCGKSRDFRHSLTILVLGNPRFSTVKNVTIGYVNTPKYFISADCSFKVSERHLTFADHARSVIVVSLTTRTAYFRDITPPFTAHSHFTSEVIY